MTTGGVSERVFVGASTRSEQGLGLALAPALTPAGLVPQPRFFSGFATHPDVVARGLLTLAEIASTRYVQPRPVGAYDPVLTAHGDSIRAEVFSACGGVMARLDLLGEGLDGGEIGRGTTNVDLAPATQQLLHQVHRDALLHLDLGVEALTLATPERTQRERRVAMPDRWVRAFGEATTVQRGLTPTMSLDATGGRAMLAGVPTTARSGTSWVAAAAGGKVRVSPRPLPHGVRVAGAHRLVAARRLMTHLRGVTVYAGADAPGPVAVELNLPGARFSLALTEQPWRGFSGEGSLLPELTGAEAMEDADLLAATLDFDPLIDVGRLELRTGLTARRLEAALAVLAADGRVGWDVREQRHYHRELPHDPTRVERDHPRLRTARRLVAAGAVRADRADRTVTGRCRRAVVRSGDTAYHVDLGGRPEEARCSCGWWLRFGVGRGPCAHLLAVQLWPGRDEVGV